MRGRTFVITGAVASAVTMLGAGLAAADPATSIPGDGLYRVGIDIAPGIYQSAGPADPAHDCSWERLWKIPEPNDPPDPNSAIVASDRTHTTPVRVLIKPSDVAFASANCGGWVMMPAPPPTGSYGPGGSFGSEY
ncbi:hypothetical protein [Nocardia veterana]|uniref:Secreted protein n=1 Tax=Nocardia veterana TaxID=132249 RepID=A0A7X6RHL1_9NOCA|nr:hypothetical protein [Nocardia veterana]NKY86150.1 hypothetical protein [Nocardia veterana]